MRFDEDLSCFDVNPTIIGYKKSKTKFPYIFVFVTLYVNVWVKIDFWISSTNDPINLILSRILIISYCGYFTCWERGPNSSLNRSISDVKFVAEVYIYTATNLTCVIPLLDINFMYGCQQTFCRECDLMKICRVLMSIRP